MKKSVTIFPTIEKRILVDCVVGVPGQENPEQDICKMRSDLGCQVKHIYCPDFKSSQTVLSNFQVLNI